ncbi:MAG: hypothetical protein H6817_10180 [Phycisphaerales bacterium]|nr:hypothetical protein [Phycisphaerales bacterium]
MKPILRILTLALVAGSLAAAGGCSYFAKDPRFQAKTAERNARINGYIDAFHAREAEGESRIAATCDKINAEDARHEKNLARTCDTIDAKMRRRRELWPSRLDATRARFDREMAGDLKSIDETIPRLFY